MSRREELQAAVKREIASGSLDTYAGAKVALLDLQEVAPAPVKRLAIVKAEPRPIDGGGVVAMG